MGMFLHKKNPPGKMLGGFGLCEAEKTVAEV
jgi:hypothetical protein